MYQSESGYFLYVVALFILTGLVCLLVDTRLLRRLRMPREGKYAFFLGWINIALGIGAWVGNWLFSSLLFG